MTMAVQKGLGRSAAAVTAAGSKGKQETKAAPAEKIDITNMSDAEAYKKLVAEAKVRKTSGVKAADMIAQVDKLFADSGEDRIMFSAAHIIAKTRLGGKKIYNPMRSAILAKGSKYTLETGEDGHAYIVRKPAA
jgi:hypothetical protein